MKKLKNISEMGILTVRDLLNHHNNFNITADDCEIVFAQQKNTGMVFKVEVKEYELLPTILFELGIGYEYLDDNILDIIEKEYDY